MAKEKDKSFESCIWDAAYSIRGAKDAPKYKEKIVHQWFVDHDLFRIHLYEPMTAKARVHQLLVPGIVN